MIPGEYFYSDTPITLNEGCQTKTIKVINTGDRPVQVGSHYHFFEINRDMKFDRQAAFGYRLNVPAGTAVRFEPQDEKEIELVEIRGNREVYGLNNKTNGKLDMTELGAYDE